ncbi:hypothetical protein BGX38DRAFT_1329471 [Terfezia claveryi]|nr:hypothetical protein BGX38DRAFT_1329471 [Terfezia claveryi]
MEATEQVQFILGSTAVQYRHCNTCNIDTSMASMSILFMAPISTLPYRFSTPFSSLTVPFRASLIEGIEGVSSHVA